jgi:hypothetical protein
MGFGVREGWSGKGEGVVLYQNEVVFFGGVNGGVNIY